MTKRKRGSSLGNKKKYNMKRKKETSSRLSIASSRNETGTYRVSFSTHETSPSSLPENECFLPPSMKTIIPKNSSSISSPSTITDEGNRDSASWRYQEQTRNAILYLFQFKYNGDSCKWNKDEDRGIISFLQQDFPHVSRNTIKSILRNKKNAVERKSRTFKGEYLIPKGSLDEQIIADLYENGHSIHRVWRIINQRKRQQGLELLTKTTINNVLKRLPSRTMKITKISQGSTNKNSDWAKAGFNLMKQLLVRFQAISPPFNDPPLPSLSVETNVAGNGSSATPDVSEDVTDDPKHFDIGSLGKLTINQLVWFDETHRICEICNVTTGTGKDEVTRFKRDEHGKLDENGAYLVEEDDQVVLSCKYDREIRLMLGVCAVKYQDGHEEGKRAKAFSYTDHTIITEKEFRRRIRDEIQRVKSIPMDENGKKKGGWIEMKRNDGDIFENDMLDKIKGISRQKMTLLKGCGLTYVKDLMKLSDEHCVKLASETKGIGKKSLLKWRAVASTAKSGDAPSNVDHTLAENPFKSRYGDDWVAKCPGVTGFTSINQLIDHMFSEAKRLMAGTVHHNDYVVYHDALSLMTGKESIKYMKEKGYWNKLIRPLNGVNDKYKRYKDRVVGNHPYLMPLDAHLNQDLHSAFDYHCVITQHLPEDDPRKFSRKTPKAMERGYLKLWDHTLPEGEGCPSSSRILRDIREVVNVSYKKLYDARGIALQHDARKGRRASEYRVKRSNNWGGIRIKSETYYLGDEWIHPSVVPLIGKEIETSEIRFSQKNKETDLTAENGLEPEFIDL